MHSFPEKSDLGNEFFAESRQNEFNLLERIFSQSLPSQLPIIWLHGSPSTGKSALIKAITSSSQCKIFFFDCNFFTDERSFFEKLGQFLDISRSLTRSTLLNVVQQEEIGAFWMILDHVDGFPGDLIEFLAKASDLAAKKISFVFVGRKSGNWVDLDCFTLLLPEFERSTVEHLVRHCLLALFPWSSIGISLMLDYFYPFYPEVKELIAIGKRIFPEFDCKELVNSASKVYKLLMPRFKQVFDSFYAIYRHSSASGAFKRFSLFGRHVLLSAFLASHNSLKRDNRLFSQKNSTCTAKRRKGRKPKNNGVSEAIYCRSIQAAKAFEVRRLIAVFQNLFQTEHKVPVSDVEIQQEIAKYCKLNLLSFVGEAGGLTKVKCRCNLTFADAESLVPSFDLKRYLFE